MSSSDIEAKPACRAVRCIACDAEFPTEDYPEPHRRPASRDLYASRGGDFKDFATSQPLDQLAYCCIESALLDANLWDSYRAARVGLVLGIGAEWMLHWEADSLKGGMRLYDPDQDRDSTIERVHRELGFSGPALALSAACASGNHALEIGRHWLRLGLVDVCVAGALDLAVSPIGLATFGNLRALSRRNAEPTAASRPFDRGRDGFVLGEGGVAFVLERPSSNRPSSA